MVQTRITHNNDNSTILVSNYVQYFANGTFKIYNPLTKRFIKADGNASKKLQNTCNLLEKALLDPHPDLFYLDYLKTTGAKHINTYKQVISELKTVEAIVDRHKTNFHILINAKVCFVIQNNINSEFIDYHVLNLCKAINEIVGTKFDNIPSSLKIKLSNENQTCSVCLDTIKSNLAETICGHTYCIDCIQQWCTSQYNNLILPKCPMCRQII